MEVLVQIISPEARAGHKTPQVRIGFRKAYEGDQESPQFFSAILLGLGRDGMSRLQKFLSDDMELQRFI